MARRNWLQAQIRGADSDVQRWPDWMKKVATFDGRRRDDPVTSRSGSEIGEKEGRQQPAKPASGRSTRRSANPSPKS
jgi:hypothetical protein